MFRKLPDTAAAAPTLTVWVNGRETPAWEGETVASVLLREPDACRLTPVSRSPRAPYCMMGVCFECLAEVDGMGSVQGCLMPVRDGMRIRRQGGAREVSA